MRRFLLPMLALVMVTAMSGRAAAVPGPDQVGRDGGSALSILDHRCGDDEGAACTFERDGEERHSIISRALEAPRVGQRPFTMAFTGDLILHSPVNGAAARYGRASDSRFDFTPMFGAVTGILSEADLAICHLEVPLSPTSTGLSGYPTFLGPAELAASLVAAGYDGCSVASNHSYDRGAAGVANTLSVLDAAGIAWAGMADSAEAPHTRTYDVAGAQVAHLSYTYWLNGFVLPDDQQFLVDVIDERAILAEAHAARTKGADVVVVSLHWGTEYRTTPTTDQTELGHRLIASPDIDLIIGHHAHVVQPIEEVDGEYIVYGLGNFLSNQRTSLRTQDGVIVIVEFGLSEGQWMASRIDFIPTWVEPGSYRILPADAAGRQSSPPQTHDALVASWVRTHDSITSLGVGHETTELP